MRKFRALTAAAAIVAATIALGAAGPASVHADGEPVVETQSSAYRLSGTAWQRTQVRVFHTWDLTCAQPPQGPMEGPTGAPVDAATMTTLLSSAIAEINVTLRGGLTLVNAGPAPAGEQCVSRSSNNPYDIVVGWAPLQRGAGLASTLSTGGTIIGSRVLLNSLTNWRCESAPLHRDAKHTMVHEVLHALGVDHSTDASAVMAPSFSFCNSPAAMHTDDLQALAALYPPTQPGPAPAVVAPSAPTASTPSAPAQTGSGSVPTPSVPAGKTYIGLAVATQDVSPSDLIAQLLGQNCRARSLAVTAGGTSVVYVPGAPAFANAQFPGVVAAQTPYFYSCG